MRQRKGRYNNRPHVRTLAEIKEGYLCRLILNSYDRHHLHYEGSSSNTGNSHTAIATGSIAPDIVTLFI